MRCTNCGLPLSPTRSMTSCPRCGAPIQMGSGVQQQPFDQGSWGGGSGASQQGFNQNMGGMAPQSPWNQGGISTGSSGYPQGDFSQQGGMRGSGFGNTPQLPRRPYEKPPSNEKKNAKILFTVAGLCVLLGALLLIFIAVLASSSSHPSTSATANNPTPATTATTADEVTPTAGPTITPTTQASASPSADGTPTGGPAKQYIDNVQMATDIDQATMQPKNPTTTFKSGSNMYVIFKLHPPATGGAVCVYWYLNTTHIDGADYQIAVKPTSTANYTYAQFGSGSSGSAYVELYWASDKTCADKQLAQRVNFTVTA